MSTGTSIDTGTHTPLGTGPARGDGTHGMGDDLGIDMSSFVSPDVRPAAAGKMVGYGQYCPISRALDLLGERWSLLILRDMIIGVTRFNDLARGLPGLSRSLLTKRLRQFERGGLVERRDNEYVLTEAGRELEPIVFGLGTWGAKWTFGDPDPTELDAQVLVWWMHTRLDTSVLPGKRHVLHIRFIDDRRPFWVLVESGAPSVCTTDPGFGVDVTITSDVSSLYQVWLGRLALEDAVRAGRVKFSGRRDVTRQMHTVFRLSPVADVVAAATRAAALRN